MFTMRRTANLNICVKINQFNKVNLDNVILLLKCIDQGQGRGLGSSDRTLTRGGIIKKLKP